MGGDTEGSPLRAEFISKMGQPLYKFQAPTGFPDRADEWISAGSLLEPLNFAVALSFNRTPGRTVNLEKITQGANGGEPDIVLKRAVTVLLDGDVSTQTRSALEKQLDKPSSVKEDDNSETSKWSLAIDRESSNGASMQSQNSRKNSFPKQTILREWSRVLNLQVSHPPPTDHKIAQVFALVIGSPEFQRR